MYPTTCLTCGAPVRSRTQATHHRRLCRTRMSEQLAVIIRMPMSFLIVAGDDDRPVRLKLSAALDKFYVSEVNGRTVVDTAGFDTAEEAASHFLSRREELGI